MRIFSFFALFFLFSCATPEFDPTDPKKSFEIARGPYDDKNFEYSIQRLSEFKSRFPYSQYTAEAELLIADAQFRLEKFAESAATYEQFTKLHPKHSKIDFAFYRIGECHWQMAPEAPDREQEYTIKAISDWRILLDKFPSSEYKASAEEKIGVGERRLAQSIEFVGNFYCKLDIFHACAQRFLTLAEQYPKFSDLLKKALLKAANSLEEVALTKAKDPESDKNLFLKSFSENDLKQKAQQLREAAEKIKKNS